MKNVADALTKHTIDEYGTIFTGNATIPVVYVEARWAWLTLLAVLTLTLIVLLVCTVLIAKKQKAPLWKASLFALLYHDLNGELRHEPVYAMGQAAEMSKVRLKISEKGDRLVLGR